MGLLAWRTPHPNDTERYRAIVHDSVFGCHHFRTFLKRFGFRAGIRYFQATAVCDRQEQSELVHRRILILTTLFHRSAFFPTLDKQGMRDGSRRERQSLRVHVAKPHRWGISHLILTFRWNSRVTVITCSEFEPEPLPEQTISARPRVVQLKNQPQKPISGQTLTDKQSSYLGGS